MQGCIRKGECSKECTVWLACEGVLVDVPDGFASNKTLPLDKFKDYAFRSFVVSKKSIEIILGTSENFPVKPDEQFIRELKRFFNTPALVQGLTTDALALHETFNEARPEDPPLETFQNVILLLGIAIRTFCSLIAKLPSETVLQRAYPLSDLANWLFSAPDAVRRSCFFGSERPLFETEEVCLLAGALSEMDYMVEKLGEEGAAEAFPEKDVRQILFN